MVTALENVDSIKIEGDKVGVEIQLIIQCAVETIQESFRNYRACKQSKLLKFELYLHHQLINFACYIIQTFIVRRRYLNKHKTNKLIVNTNVVKDVDELSLAEIVIVKSMESNIKRNKFTMSPLKNENQALDKVEQPLSKSAIDKALTLAQSISTFPPLVVPLNVSNVKRNESEGSEISGPTTTITTTESSASLTIPVSQMLPRSISNPLLNSARHQYSARDLLYNKISASNIPIRLTASNRNLVIDKKFDEAITCRCAVVKMEYREVLKIFDAIGITLTLRQTPMSNSEGKSSLHSARATRKAVDGHVFIPILHAPSLAATLTKFIQSNSAAATTSSSTGYSTDASNTVTVITQELAEVTADHLKKLVMGTWDSIRSFVLRTCSCGNMEGILTSASSSTSTATTTSLRPAQWSSDHLLEFLELLNLSDTTMTIFQHNIKSVDQQHNRANVINSTTMHDFLCTEEEELLPDHEYDIKSTLLRTRVLVYQQMLSDLDDAWDLNIRPWDVMRMDHKTSSGNIRASKGIAGGTEVISTKPSSVSLTNSARKVSYSDKVLNNSGSNNRISSARDKSSGVNTTKTIAASAVSSPIKTNMEIGNTHINTDTGNSQGCGIGETSKTKSKTMMKKKKKKKCENNQHNLKSMNRSTALWGSDIPPFCFTHAQSDTKNMNDIEEEEELIAVEIGSFDMLIQGWTTLNRAYGWRLSYTDLAALAVQLGGTTGYLVNSIDDLGEYVPRTKHRGKVDINNDVITDAHSNSVHSIITVVETGNNLRANDITVASSPPQVTEYDMKCFRWVSVYTDGNISENDDNTTPSNTHRSSLRKEFDNHINNDNDKNKSAHVVTVGINRLNLPPLSNSSSSSSFSSSQSIINLNNTRHHTSSSSSFRNGISVNSHLYPFITADSLLFPHMKSILIPLSCLRLDKSIMSSSTSSSRHNTSRSKSSEDTTYLQSSLMFVDKSLLSIGMPVQIADEIRLTRACERFDWWDRPPIETIKAMAGRQGEIISLLELGLTGRIGVRVTGMSVIVAGSVSSSGRAVIDALPIEALFLNSTSNLKIDNYNNNNIKPIEKSSSSIKRSTLENKVMSAIDVSSHNSSEFSDKSDDHNINNIIETPADYSWLRKNSWQAFGAKTMTSLTTATPSLPTSIPVSTDTTRNNKVNGVSALKVQSLNLNLLLPSSSSSSSSSMAITAETTIIDFTSNKAKKTKKSVNVKQSPESTSNINGNKSKFLQQSADLLNRIDSSLDVYVDNGSNNRNNTNRNNKNKNKQEQQEQTYPAAINTNLINNNITTSTAVRPTTAINVSANISIQQQQQLLTERHAYKNGILKEREKQSRLRQRYTFNSAQFEDTDYAPDPLPNTPLNMNANTLNGFMTVGAMGIAGGSGIVKPSQHQSFNQQSSSSSSSSTTNINRTDNNNNEATSVGISKSSPNGQYWETANMLRTFSAPYMEFTGYKQSRTTNALKTNKILKRSATLSSSEFYNRNKPTKSNGNDYNDDAYEDRNSADMMDIEDFNDSET